MAACEQAPWWTSPVILSGSGGSGTRGAAMLLDRLGVRIACVDESRPRLFDPAVCNVTCNSAGDCKLINSFYDPSLSFLHISWLGRRADASCGVHDHHALNLTMERQIPFSCNGTRAAAFLGIRESVRPEYRKRLRWGMKNPHATYFANVLREFFPCMVMVNTIRDLAEMGKSMKHYYSRVQEAKRLGWISANETTVLAAIRPVELAGHAAREAVSDSVVARDTNQPIPQYTTPTLC